MEKIKRFLKKIEEGKNTKWDYITLCVWSVVVSIEVYQFFTTDEMSFLYVLSGVVLLILMMGLVIRRKKNSKVNS